MSSSPPSQSAPQAAKPAAAPAPKAPQAEPAKLQPYNKGAGHHVPAKKAFEGPQGYAPGYDPNKALAIPKAELERLGVIHTDITTAQRRAYIDYAKNGAPLTWEAIGNIETNALVQAGMKFDMANATVVKAIQALKDSGVTAPLRVPWGK